MEIWLYLSSCKILLFNDFRSTSLQILWGLINVLQLIVNMPLLNLHFPTNSLFFYSLLLDITNFDIIPKGFIDSIFIIEQDSENGADDENVSESFESQDIF